MGRIKRGDRSGIDVTYVKSRRHLYIGGWYDSFVGIETIDFPIAELLVRLGVTLRDMDKIKADMQEITVTPAPDDAGKDGEG